MKIITVLAICLVGLSGAVQARDTVVNIALADVLAMPEAKEKLDGSVRFYLKGQALPKQVDRQGSDVSNKKTNGVGKTDEFACQWATLSALISLQEGARKRGANAVVDIVSYYKKNETVNATTIECHAGNIVVGVALKGDYAKVN